MVDLDVNSIQSVQRRVSFWQVIIRDRGLSEWSGGLWELVLVQFLGSAHILQVNPCPLGQLGGTVSCLKSSQFTGPFKVNTPTRGPQDYKNYKHWAVRASQLRHADAHLHAHMHTHTPTVNCPFIFDTKANAKTKIKSAPKIILPHAAASMTYKEYWQHSFFFFWEEIEILRWLWEGNVRYKISFQTWHTPVSIRTQIKATSFAYRSASPTDLTKCPHCATPTHYW